MSFKQPQNTYPYFCFSGPATTGSYTITSAAAGNSIFSTQLDLGSNHFSNGVFTAPVNGAYYFQIILNVINNSATSDDTGNWGIKITYANSTVSYRVVTDNPENIATTGTEYVTQFSGVVYLDSNSTVQMYGNGFASSGNTVEFTANQSFFMGYLINRFN